MLKYVPPPQSAGVLSYVREFVWCWLQTLRLVVLKSLRGGFDVIQACNPPDTYFLLALPFKLFGKRFVFDHHDLSPEMYTSRFEREGGLILSALRILERLTFISADHVISTNGSYAEIAQVRGRLSARKITIVQSAPDPNQLRKVTPTLELKRGHDFMICWLGIMGPQDGVDIALRSFAHYVHELGRTDTLFAILGFGDAEKSLRALAEELNLSPHVYFTGRADQAMIASYLSTADLGLVPDKKTAYADLSTHNKTLEYMSFGLPVVTVNLQETCRSAGDAALIVQDGDVPGFATAIAELLDDPQRRERMGGIGRDRIENELGWQYQAERYLQVFRDLPKK